jgi:hypothetical protein
MSLEQISLLAYLVYLPFLLLLIFWAAKKHKHFFIAKRLLSTLAETSSPSFEIVSFLIAVFSLLRIIFVSNLAKFLPDLLASKVGLFFLYASCLGSLLAAFFPRDKFRQFHGVFGTLLFAGTLGSVLFLTHSFKVSPLIPDFIVFLNIIMGGLVFLVLASDYVTVKRLNGFVSKYRFLWQWTLLFLVIAWDFILVTVTLSLLNS